MNFTGDESTCDPASAAELASSPMVAAMATTAATFVASQVVPPLYGRLKSWWQRTQVGNECRCFSLSDGYYRPMYALQIG
jgi:hypothetical protein